MSADFISDNDLMKSARRAARESGAVVASLVSVWERAFPHEELTVSLGCSKRVVSELSLCLRPRLDGWVDDVGEIAKALGIDSIRLEAFFKKTEILERLSLAHGVDQTVGELMAARDRDEDE